MTYCREAYVDGAAVNAHLANVGALFGQFLTEAATLERVRLHGNASELAVMRPDWDALGLGDTLKYWRNVMGFSVMQEVFDTLPADASGYLPYEFATIMPTFTINDWPKVQTYLNVFVERTYYGESVPNASVLYYGWDVLEDENGTVTHLFCREAYKNGAGVVAHLNNVGGLLGEMLGTGAATLTELHFTGPFTDAEKAEVESILGGTQTFYDTSTSSTDSDIIGFSQRIGAAEPGCMLPSSEDSSEDGAVSGGQVAGMIIGSIIIGLLPGMLIGYFISEKLKSTTQGQPMLTEINTEMPALNKANSRQI